MRLPCIIVRSDASVPLAKPLAISPPFSYHGTRRHRKSDPCSRPCNQLRRTRYWRLSVYIAPILARTR
ncbi:MAG: hypothetical protein DIU65_13420, partial [Proteobacteria bacterium]